MSLTEHSQTYKPFKYPDFVNRAVQHEKLNWNEAEADLREDVRQWKGGVLTAKEKYHITSILRLFTASDYIVGNTYEDYFIPYFRNNEARMMLCSFANRECFDDQTEILTENGWKFFSELNDEKVAQYDLDSGSITFVKPEDKLIKDYNGKLDVYSSNSTDICVTPGHELITINPHTKRVTKKKSGEYTLGGNFLYPTSGFGTSSNKQSLETYTRLLIAVQADGTLQGLCPSENEANKAVFLGLTKPRKMVRLENLLNECGIPFTKTLCDRGSYRYRFKLREDTDLAAIKSLDFIKLNNLDARVATQIIEEIVEWDGTKSGNVDRYYNTNKRAVDKVQAIATLSGCISAVVGVNREEGYIGFSPSTGKQFENTKTCYVVNLLKRNTRCYPHKTTVNYSGKVYCVTVPYGNIVTRRNGKIAITGNCTHQRAYALLNDTLGLDEEEYIKFLEVPELKTKAEYMVDNFSKDSYTDMGISLAQTVCNEGVSLFSSFAMLLNYQRFGKMKGMCEIVEWSLRDESLHCDGMVSLFRQFCEEHPRIVNDEFKKTIYLLFTKAVELEDAVIDVAYRDGSPEGLPRKDIKEFVRFMADRRVTQLGLKPIFNIDKQPLEWYDSIVSGDSLKNFFEGRVTDYSIGGMNGDWGWNDDKQNEEKAA